MFSLSWHEMVVAGAQRDFFVADDRNAVAGKHVPKLVSMAMVLEAQGLSRINGKYLHHGRLIAANPQFLPPRPLFAMGFRGLHRLLTTL